MPENNDLLSRMKAEAFNGTNEKDKSISVSDQQNEAEVIGRKSNNAAIIQQYHLNAIKSAQTVQKWAMIIFTFVTIIIVVLIFIVLFKSDLALSQQIIPISTACFVDFLSATIVCLMKSILKSKDKYFESCSKDEELNKMLGMVDKMKDGEAKNKMISKLVSSYCSHDKN